MAIKIISYGSGRIDNPDSENMVKFAVQLINRSHTVIQNGSIIDERIAILHLDHGTELLMKAYLLKEGYIIKKVDQNKFKEGIKKDSSINEYLIKDRTIGFADAFNIVSKKVDLSENTKKIITDFHNLRNEIQHRALEIPLNKSERINKFKPQLKEIVFNPRMMASHKTLVSSDANIAGFDELEIQIKNNAVLLRSSCAK